MKIIKYSLLLVFLLSLNSCKQQNTDKDKTSSVVESIKDKDIQFLKDFYEEYLSACSEQPNNYSTLENIKKKYLSEDLYNKLNIAELDYDPFLDAQDCDESWIKTIEIKAVLSKEGTYQLFYNDGSKKKDITLSLINRNGKLLINNIENNSDL